MHHQGPIVGLVLAALIGASACTSGAGPTTRPMSSSRPAADPSATAAWPAGAPDAWLLVGSADDRANVRVIQASTGESFLDMPVGASPRADWLHEIVATPSGAQTKVSDVLVQPGLGGPEIAIDGAWRLPTIGYDPMPVGLSADGSTTILVEATPSAEGPAAVSRFAVLNIAPLKAPAKIVELQGSFEYDAVSSDGRILYVVEHLPGEGSPYQVRAIDLPTGTMRAAVITDKRNLGEAMAGWPIAQLRSPIGVVFTLYNGLEHPFIHALDTTDAWAVCIDLPATPVADQTAALHWGLAASPDWRTVYAANGKLGQLSVVDTTELTIRKSVAIGSVADRGPAITLAKFGHTEGGPVGRRTVVAPDGRTAYVAGANGVLAINTIDLAVTARLLEGSSVDALGVTPDGRAIFALLHDRGRIVALDPVTGAIFGEVPGGGFDRLLAVVPW
jgi:hypothetical protein